MIGAWFLLSTLNTELSFKKEKMLKKKKKRKKKRKKKNDKHQYFLYLFFKKYFIYLFLEHGEGREKERERETTMCGCLLRAPHWGPGLQPRHVPDWESNHDPLVRRPALNPLSYTSQG